MRIKLNTGETIEGTVEELTNYVNRKENKKKLDRGEFGTRYMYWSDSKDIFIPIPKMQTHHLRNAINKIYKSWVEKLYKLEPKDYSRALRLGCEDVTFIALVRELFKREDAGELDD